MDAKIINEQKTMQLATTCAEQPWICTVYFVLQNGKFYWLSLPERRHSKELADNSRAAIAIAIKQDKPVMGVQAEGDVAVVQDSVEVEAVLDAYVAKYGQGKEFVQRFMAGKNQHLLYRLSPRKTLMFDELHHSNNPHQEISL